jgi:hypothetical protein
VRHRQKQTAARRRAKPASNLGGARIRGAKLKIFAGRGLGHGPDRDHQDGSPAACRQADFAIANETSPPQILASGRGQLNVVAMNDGDNSPHPVLVGLIRAGWKSVHSRAVGHDRIRKPSLRSVVLLSAD